MASRLTSLLCNVGNLPCDLDCLSTRKCEHGGINLCHLASIGMNKGKTLDDCLTASSSDDRYNYQDSSDMNKYYFDGCIKKEGFVYKIEASNLNARNMCPGLAPDRDDYHPNEEEENSSNVIDLDDEVLIGNFPFGCLREVAQGSMNNFENGNSRVIITERNLMITRKDTDLTGHNARIGGKQSSHLYSEIVKPDAAGSEHSAEEGDETEEKGETGRVIFPPSFDATNGAHDDMDEVGRAKRSTSSGKKKRGNNRAKKKKESEEGRGKNLRSMFGFFASAEPAVSNSSRSCRGKVSDASSEFLSVISGVKSNA
ncbi:PhIL1-interacting candidate PIC4, putative [Plasmodium vivax]|nr:PhIL1-interacting candidate PIC4, putative [Plasmodium vivax]